MPMPQQLAMFHRRNRQLTGALTLGTPGLTHPVRNGCHRHQVLAAERSTCTAGGSRRMRCMRHAIPARRADTYCEEFALTACSRHAQAMTRRPLARLAGAVLVAGLLVSCSPSSNSGKPDRLVIATTVSPLTNIVANVVGDRADVTGIVPEGTNSHTFEPAPQVAELLSRADIVFVNGLKLEDPTLELAKANMKDGARIVELATSILPEKDWIYDFSFPKSGGKPNPHLWTDPLYAVKYAQLVRDTVITRDPANTAVYAANYDKYAAQLQALTAALRADSASLPAASRTLLTYHDAYAYFAKDFGWTVIGALQPKNFEDPSAAEVARLIDQVRRYKVKVIFGSEVFPSKVLQEIGRATGARYEASLRDDDLPGAPGDAEHSLVGLLRYDFRTMIAGLGGTTSALDALSVSNTSPDSATYPQ